MFLTPRGFRGGFPLPPFSQFPLAEPLGLGSRSVGSANVYWVGGSGNWTDSAHWSLTSGGVPNAAVPSPYDNVIVDANSGASPTITVNAAAYCGDLDFSTANGTPVLAGSAALNIFGSLTKKLSMTWTYSGTLTFAAVILGKVISSAGVAYAGNVVFGGTGGGWTLFDDFNAAGFNVSMSSTANLNTNSQVLSAANFSGSDSPTLTLVGSRVKISNSWSFPSGGTLSAAFSIIQFTDAVDAAKTFAGGNKAYGIIYFNSTGTGPLLMSAVGSLTGLFSDKGLVTQLPGGATIPIVELLSAGTQAGAGDARFAAHLDATAGYSTPDIPANRVSSNFTLEWFGISLSWSATQYLLYKDSQSSPNRDWGLYLSGSSVVFYYSPDGGATIYTATSSATIAPAANLPFGVRAKYTAGTGAVVFEKSTDGAAWSALGATQTLTVGTPHVGSSPVRVGSVTGLNAFTGRTYRAKVYNDATATNVVVDFNPADFVSGATWMSSSQNKEWWTSNGANMISATNLVGLLSSSASPVTLSKSGGGISESNFISEAGVLVTPTNAFYADNSLFQDAATNWVVSKRNPGVGPTPRP